MPPPGPKPTRSRSTRSRGNRGPRAFLSARQSRRRWIGAALVIMLAAAVLADRSGWLAYQGDDLARYHNQTFQVARVIDGDTLDLDIPDGERPTTRIRLWGIDAPEMAWPERGRNEPEPFAEQATAFVRDRLDNQRVALELEPHRLRGRFGRLLAHVYIIEGDNRTSLNQLLLLKGLARADDRWSHRYLDEYAAAEQKARNAHRGLWTK